MSRVIAPRCVSSRAIPHLNIRHGFRGQRIGHRLLERFVRQAREAGCCGMHAAVRGDNTTAQHFFEQHGFDVASRRPVVAYDGAGYQRRDATVYGKLLERDGRS